MRGGRVGGVAHLLSVLAPEALDKELDRDVRVPGASPIAGVPKDFQGPVIMKKDIERGAAQFIAGYRKGFHRTGMMDFEAPRGAKLPPWMALILRELRARPRHWNVVFLQPRGKAKKVFRVTWKWWMRCGADARWRKEGAS
jgi:hypothetical protein